MEEYYYQGQGDLADVLMPGNPDTSTTNGDGGFGDPFSNTKGMTPFEEKEGDVCGDGRGFPLEISFSNALYVPPQQDVYVPFSDIPFGHLRGVDTATDMRISAVENSSMKRRKGQAKKVVCIPAPASGKGRSGGEVVPSDRWSWRKYGQKPIKSSPYPRGYYRCSSSKGCSARKQVERSHADPNMLVVTYTCEHNHPWPTQRNNNGSSSSSSSNTVQRIPSSSSSPSTAAAGGSSRHAKEETDITNIDMFDESGITGSADVVSIDGGGDPLRFLLSQGVTMKNSATASDSLGGFFDWLD